MNKDSMAESIKKWLEEEKMFKDKVVDNKTYFHFLGENPVGSGQLFDIFHPSNKDVLK